LFFGCAELWLQRTIAIRLCAKKAERQLTNIGRMRWTPECKANSRRAAQTSVFYDFRIFAYLRFALAQLF